MELISLKAACDAILKEYDDYPYDERARGLNDAVGIIIDEVPTIPAVPLEPLAEWLAERYEPPYTFIDIDKLKVPIDFRQQKEIWMVALTKWMEEQDANRP